MNISQGKTLDLELKILKILEITLSLRQRSSMMPASLRTHHYVLRELRSFPGSIRPGNHRTRLEIAGESVFDFDFCRSGDAHRPTNNYEEPAE